VRRRELHVELIDLLVEKFGTIMLLSFTQANSRKKSTCDPTQSVKVVDRST
jgi:hypothetical protein